MYWLNTLKKLPCGFVTKKGCWSACPDETKRENAQAIDKCYHEHKAKGPVIKADFSALEEDWSDI
ncbi:MAG: hypothetical protein PHR07_03985 [Acidaminococcaceae bacterium]|jgi:hypothetical protein|nr:hypothetical protein [Acidaminococcaceae bacterium]